jgi:hypothetical protein
VGLVATHWFVIWKTTIIRTLSDEVPDVDVTVVIPTLPASTRRVVRLVDPSALVVEIPPVMFQPAGRNWSSMLGFGEAVTVTKLEQESPTT